ncbi:MAG: hypothetical protein ACLFSH_01955 [Phormidium sp.]
MGESAPMAAIAASSFAVMVQPHHNLLLGYLNSGISAEYEDSWQFDVYHLKLRLLARSSSSPA